jgi:hypothetical protein
MKNTFFLTTLSLLVGFSSVFGQEASPAKDYLPKSGDFGIQMDASPFVNFALNAVNIMADNGFYSPSPSYVSGFNQAIVGKYFIKDDQALRLRLGINTATETEIEYGDDPLTPSITNNILLSTNVDKSSMFLIGGGLEFRRGGSRLQGYYGGDLNLMINRSRYKYTYEVPYTQAAADSGYMLIDDSRDLEGDDGTIFTFNLRGFAGVEYFVLPKISIGAEFGLGYSISSEARGDYTEERWEVVGSASDPSANVVTEAYNYADRERGFGVDNGIGGTSTLNVTFHF